MKSKKNKPISNIIGLIKSVLFMTLTLLLIYPVLSTASVDTNLVANPSFENGDIIPLSWTFVTYNGNTPFWDTVAHSGARSVRVQINGTTNKISGYPKSDIISVQPLTNYTLSSWVKTRGSGGRNGPAVRVVELDANKNRIRQTNLIFSKGTNNWTQGQIIFQTDSNTNWVYVYANTLRGYGTFWIDDVKLSLKSTPTPSPTPAPTPTPTPTPAPTSTPIPNNATYIIYITGSTINAKNTSTGQIEFTGTDISTILTSVNNAITDGGTMSIQEGTYAPSSPVTFTKSIKLIADGNVIFNWNTKSQFLFTFSGSDLSTPNITGNVAAGSNTISVSSVGTAQPGDLVLIKDNTVFNPTDFPKITNGELHEIASISGNTITLTDLTNESFTAARSGYVRLIRPITVEVNGITIVGGSSTDDFNGINLYYNKNSIIRNSTFKNNGDIEIQVYSSYNTIIEKNVISDNILDGMGYGIEVYASSAYTTISNNYFSNCRHCISQGGGTGGAGGIPRETTIISNTFADSTGTQDVVDAHAVVESTYIYNNTIYSPPSRFAVGSGAKVTRVIGNTVYEGYGTRIAGHVPAPITFEVTGNEFIDSRWVFYRFDTLNVPHEISVKGNIIKGSIWGIVQMYHATSFVISGNQFNSTNTSSGYWGMDVENSSNGIISNNTIQNAYYSGIQFVSVNNTTVSNNTFTYYNINGGDSEYGIKIVDSTYNTYSNNVLIKHPDIHAYGIIESGTSDYNRIFDNNLSGVGTSAVISQRIKVVGKNTLVKNNLGYNT